MGAICYCDRDYAAWTGIRSYFSNLCEIIQTPHLVSHVQVLTVDVPDSSDYSEAALAKGIEATLPTSFNRLSNLKILRIAIHFHVYTFQSDGTLCKCLTSMTLGLLRQPIWAGIKKSEHEGLGLQISISISTHFRIVVAIPFLHLPLAGGEAMALPSPCILPKLQEFCIFEHDPLLEPIPIVYL
ncbi:hypothetical protein HGRIS_011528 [Hohenbuehelia grisea]|uniref:Uncharacterized protein n=1 Tax=Hohenbuehelia grisea TaxID=104357 RepID=A0ABR3JVC5_9AGAR